MINEQCQLKSSNETTECFRFLNHITYLKELFTIDIFSLTPCLPLTYSSLVENKGFEPLTPCVQGRCSSQLS